jgi:hypothetical protein
MNRNDTNCGENGVISRFYMPNDLQQKYTYTCSNSQNVNNKDVSIKNLYNDGQTDGMGDKYVGMSSNLQCDPSSALSNFFLHGHVDGRALPELTNDGPYNSDGTGPDIAMNYFSIGCKHIPDLTDCTKMQTPPRNIRWSDDYWEGQAAITGYDVNCSTLNDSDNKYSLTGWKYVKDPQDFTYHIDYNCCRVNEK